jgi:hypothetical protein
MQPQLGSKGKKKALVNSVSEREFSRFGKGVRIGFFLFINDRTRQFARTQLAIN